MPFPLAHPAAVLPFRRYCPRWLNFPSLIIGSLIPDLSYCTGVMGVEHFAHRIWGSVGFALPAGLLAAWIFYALRKPFVKCLPEHLRTIFLPLCERPAGPLWTVALAIVLGACTHITIDSISHGDGWLVERFPVFRKSAGNFFGHKMTFFQIWWFAFTCLGAFWLSLAYLKWLSQTTKAAHLTSAKVRAGCALVMAGLVLGLGLAHRLVHHSYDLFLIICAMLALAAGFVMVMGLRLKKVSR
jgi:hypothetical protein